MALANKASSRVNPPRLSFFIVESLLLMTPNPLKVSFAWGTG